MVGATTSTRQRGIRGAWSSRSKRSGIPSGDTAEVRAQAGKRSFVGGRVGIHIARVPRNQPRSVAMLRSTKRVDDAEPLVEHGPVLHVFGSERVAIGVQRRGGDHRIVGRQPVALCEREARFVNLDGERLHRQQTADHGQKRARLCP
jgi:hypothetical protein